MKFYLSALVLLFFLVVAFIFGSQNPQVIELNYLIAKSDITVAMAVSIFTLLGFLIGVLFMLLFIIGKKLKRTGKKSTSLKTVRQ